MNHAQPKPGFSKYNGLMADLERGYIQIPKFQRDFVWSKKESADLIDSLLKGYPIGTFILWRTRERFNNVKALGDQKFPTVPDNYYIKYILDGQQRLASLYVIVKGLQVEKDDKKIDYKNIYVDLDAQNDSENIVDVEKPNGVHITVYDMLNGNFVDLMDTYDREHIEKIITYKTSLTSYDFSTILIDDYPIEKTVEVFNRINTKGKSLALFDIMVAKTRDNQSFDLRDKYESLCKTLDDATYEIPSQQLLHCISINLTGECTRKKILGLPSNEIVKIWDETVNAIKSAIDHFSASYPIPVSRLLPYSALIVPFSYFFFKNGKNPTQQQDIYLKEYFWKSSLRSRFNNSVASKLALDCKFMEAIMDGKRPDYGKEFNVELKKEDIREIPFSLGESVSKAVLCVMLAAGPRSLGNNDSVTLNNFRLSRSNGRNYHHFFPKAFLKKQNIERPNLVSNITLLTELENKEIGDSPPSHYIKRFKENNSNLDVTLKTHLIDSLDDYGVYNNDYNTFIKARSDRIWKELKIRFDPDNREIDDL